ncbi:unnamed protein product, partial [Iphiclides podalirius]
MAADGSVLGRGTRRPKIDCVRASFRTKAVYGSGDADEFEFFWARNVVPGSWSCSVRSAAVHCESEWVRAAHQQWLVGIPRPQASRAKKTMTRILYSPKRSINVSIRLDCPVLK